MSHSRVRSRASLWLGIAAVTVGGTLFVAYEPPPHAGSPALRGSAPSARGQTQETFSPKEVDGHRAETLPPTRSFGQSQSDQSDTPSANLSGSIRDAIGGPIVGARLSIAGSAGKETLSNADGRFGMNVGEGPLRLIAAADGYATREMALSSPREGIEFVLIPAGRVDGRVLEAQSRQPVAGVKVTANVIPALGTPGSTAITDEEGRFVLERMSAGTYDVVAEAESQSGSWRGLPVGVAEVVGPIDIELRPSAALTGSVQVGAKPCPGAMVTVSGADQHYVETGQDGKLEIRGLAPGRYTARVDCPRALHHEEILSLTAGHNVHTWSLDAGRALTGRVEAADGQPLVGALVSMSPRVEEHGARNPSGAAARGTYCVSGEQGLFECSGLDVGVYDCILMVKGERQSVHEIVAITDQTLNEPLLLQADPSATILIRLQRTEIATMPPVAVFVQRTGGIAVLAEQHGASYSLGPLPLGSYSVYLGPSSESSASKTQVVLQRDGEVKEVELSLPKLGSVRGRLIGSDGIPIPDTWVNPRSADAVWKFSSDASASRLTDAEGAFDLANLMPGRYRFHVQDNSGQRLLEQFVEVPAGSDVEVTLVMSAKPLATSGTE